MEQNTDTSPRVTFILRDPISLQLWEQLAPPYCQSNSMKRLWDKHDHTLKFRLEFRICDFELPPHPSEVAPLQSEPVPFSPGSFSRPWLPLQCELFTEAGNCYSHSETKARRHQADFSFHTDVGLFSHPRADTGEAGKEGVGERERAGHTAPPTSWGASNWGNNW